MSKRKALRTTAPLELTQTIKDDDVQYAPDLRAHQNKTVDDSHTVAEPINDKPVITQEASFGTRRGEPRYQISELLGSGGGGFVYEATDNNLGRSIAVKVTPQSKLTDNKFKQKVLREASLTSKLDHPNIPPVYDLGLDRLGRIYYSMKKISGKPLSSFISKDETDTPITLSINELVDIISQTCLAASFANNRGIYHRDIKPDNIMIGQHGEVYLVDWGIAIDKNSPPNNDKMAGTPIYMSPEQARREQADERSDIYSLGATFYHALFDLLPVEIVDTETFWEHKKTGIIPKVNNSNIPPDLVAICMKCLAARPEDRYQNMSSLLADLKCYRQGNMVSVYKYSLGESISFHLKKSSKQLTWTILFSVITIAASVYIYKYYQLQQTSWGDPIYSQDFSEPNDWAASWINASKRGDLKVQDGKLKTLNGNEFIWFYEKELNGSIAIEFEGSIPEDSEPGDLSIVFSPELNKSNGGSYVDNYYYLQHGAVNNSCSIIETVKSRMDYNRVVLKKNVTYKIRGEIDSNKLRLYLNGKLVCSHDLLFPVTKGHIGLYSFYEGKLFDNIKIYNRDLPQLTSITKTGDLLYDKAQYELALRRYNKISKDYKGSEISIESRFKAGLCHIKIGEPEKALTLWKGISHTAYINQINHYRWQELYSNAEFETLAEEIAKAYKNNQNKEQIKLEWAHYLDAFTESGNLAMIDQLLQIRNDFFPRDQVFSAQVFEALSLKGEPNRALIMFPEQDQIIIHALLASGQYSDIIQKYPHQLWAVRNARFHLGQFDYIINHLDNDLHGFLLNAFIASGKLDQAMKHYHGNTKAINHLLLFGYGDIDEFQRRNPDNEDAHIRSLYYQGRLKEFLRKRKETDHVYSTSVFDAELAISLDNYFSASDRNSVFHLTKNIKGAIRGNTTQIFSVHFLPYILHALNGDEHHLQQQQVYIHSKLKNLQGKRTWYCSRLLEGVIGKSEFMNQPNKLNIEYDYFFYSALHHDLAGNTTLAARSYQRAIELPRYKRYYNHTMEHFIKHRITQLLD